MKTKLERFVLGLILAPILPLAGFLGFWWGTYALLPESWISAAMLVGLLVGILADFLVFPKLMERVHRLDWKFWAALFLFYAFGTFGFFMGVPVFNVGLAIPAGFVVGGRLAHEMADEARVRAATRRVCAFTTIILTFVCVASASFALVDSTTAANLEEMLALPFAVTQSMIWGLILIGGAGLLVANWFFAALSVRLTHRWLGAQ